MKFTTAFGKKITVHEDQVFITYKYSMQGVAIRIWNSITNNILQNLTEVSYDKKKL